MNVRYPNGFNCISNNDDAGKRWKGLPALFSNVSLKVRNDEIVQYEVYEEHDGKDPKYA